MFEVVDVILPGTGFYGKPHASLGKSMPGD